MKVKIEECGKCGNKRPVWKRVNRIPYCKTCCPSKSISKKSVKRSIKEIEYSDMRKDFLLFFCNCKAKLSGCTLASTEIHHMKGRIGDLLLDKEWWLPVCRNCHTYIEEHPNEAKLLGLSFSRNE